jgi:hypothetical protein
MSNQKTAALRTTSTEHAAAATVIAPSQLDTRPVSDAAVARGSSATTSPLRPWRSTPRPTAWQPGTWGDVL